MVLLPSAQQSMMNMFKQNVSMDYRARGSWIGNVRGRLGKAGYGGSDVTCILVCISSVMRVRGSTAIYQALAT